MTGNIMRNNIHLDFALRVIFEPYLPLVITILKGRYALNQFVNLKKISNERNSTVLVVTS